MSGRRFVLIFLALALLVGSAFVIGIVQTAPGAPIASMEDLRENNVLFLEEHDIFLVYNGGRPLALSSDAQHLGDTVEFCESSQMFESPAHGEKFDIRGFYYAGPAMNGLDRYPIRVQADAIYVEVDQVIAGPQRGRGPAREPAGPFCTAT